MKENVEHRCIGMAPYAIINYLSYIQIISQNFGRLATPNNYRLDIFEMKIKGC